MSDVMAGFFNRENTGPLTVEQYDQLKLDPSMMLVTDAFAATWVEAGRCVLCVQGDYTHANPYEVQLMLEVTERELVRQRVAQAAKLN